jgi:hypothetical protein
MGVSQGQSARPSPGIVGSGQRASFAAVADFAGLFEERNREKALSFKPAGAARRLLDRP